MRLRYLHLDVFTGVPFAGNQLAVFPEPGELTAPDMQAIAKEMAFSESTFVFPPTGRGDVRMRIFTPGSELPMAGHPTIGSTFALALEGVIAAGRPEFVFELGVGPTRVSLEWRDEALAFAWMTQPSPQFGAIVADRAALAQALGVEDAHLARELPAQVVSSGVPFLFVPLASRAAVDAAAIDRRALQRMLASAGEPERPVFLFTLDGSREGETVYSRMLGPVLGVPEDPATGGASGPLGAYLVQYALVPPERALDIVSLQGVAMGRPSRIHVAIDGRPGHITRVRVGGQSVLVGRGEILR
ncbi:MAG TPA: PhzF family phenazine biosynthesis protein [Vicinamibacterales bacterium]|nr:PhzF family phenazine biosynthesis protein [Vicinamibacterales bacterium]